MIMRLPLLLLALIATPALCRSSNEYRSREQYAEENFVVLADTLTPATTPEYCKTGSDIYLPDTGEGRGQMACAKGVGSRRDGPARRRRRLAWQTSPSIPCS